MRLSTILFLLLDLTASHVIRRQTEDQVRFIGISLTPGARITRFDSTLIVPAQSTDKLDGQADPRFMWPGLQPSGAAALLQTVLTNQHPGAPINQWLVEPWWCCHLARILKNATNVYPGDSLTHSFQWNAQAGNWHVSWTYLPGYLGNAAGQTSSSNGLIEDGNNDTVYAQTNYSPMNEAILTIELQGNSTWDFGPVEWRDIIIVAETADQTWCSQNSTAKPGYEFQSNRTTPVATTVGNTTTCYIADMWFLSVDENATVEH